MISSKPGAVNPLLIVIILVLLVAAGAWALIVRNTPADDVIAPTNPSPTVSTSPSPPPTVSPQPSGSASSAMEEDIVRTIALEAGSFYYKPNEIRVKKGETIRIEMTAKDMMHDFNIDELGVKLPITKAGKTASVEFTADKVGNFEFYCSVSDHRTAGQVGTLIVE